MMCFQKTVLLPMALHEHLRGKAKYFLSQQLQQPCDNMLGKTVDRKYSNTEFKPVNKLALRIQLSSDLKKYIFD